MPVTNMSLQIVFYLVTKLLRKQSPDRTLKLGSVLYLKLKINNLYLPSAVFIAQRLVGASKQLKETIQIEHNIVKNPN